MWNQHAQISVRISICSNEEHHSFSAGDQGECYPSLTQLSAWRFTANTSAARAVASTSRLLLPFIRTPNHLGFSRTPFYLSYRPFYHCYFPSPPSICKTADFTLNTLRHRAWSVLAFTLSISYYVAHPLQPFAFSPCARDSQPTATLKPSPRGDEANQVKSVLAPKRPLLLTLAHRLQSDLMPLPFLKLDPLIMLRLASLAGLSAGHMSATSQASSAATIAPYR